MNLTKKIRVLIVDDSAVARDLLERGLSLDSEIEVVGKASDAYAARDKIVFLKPDVLTLDVEMPRMDGIEFLKRLIPQYPIPTVVVSAVTADGSRRALEAMDAGAVEVVGKPSATDRNAFREMLTELTEKVKAAAASDLSKLASKVKNAGVKRTRRAEGSAAKPVSQASRSVPGRVIAIGASTGGTAALHRIIEAFPADMPPVVVVQHMPPVFTHMFAEALDRSSAVRVLEAADGDILIRGTVFIAPGDSHLSVVPKNGTYVISLSDDAKVSGHRPSVDVMFESVAKTVGADGIGVLLTGMGHDGAAGLGSMRFAGARCIAQDEASSVVWGMPREAWEAGAAEKLVALDDIAREIAVLIGREDRV